MTAAPLASVPPEQNTAAAKGAIPPVEGLAGEPSKQQLHDALFGDPANLTAPINTVEDKFQLLPAFIKVRGLPRPMTIFYPKGHLHSHGQFVRLPSLSVISMSRMSEMQ